MLPEGIGEKPKTIELPRGLVPRFNPPNKSLESLLLRLSKTDVNRNKDGLAMIGNRILNNVNFDEFVSDCCQGKFSDRYENIYCELRKNGITF